MKKTYFCKSNMLRILILMTLLVTVSIGVIPLNAAETDRKIETKSKASVSVDDQHALCQKVSILIKNKTIFKYALDSVNVPDTPKTDSFINIDIDGDDISDKIIRSCGTGECGLEIELSGGGEIGFDSSPFFLIRLRGQIYILVGVGNLSKPSKNPTFGLYLLNKKGVGLICDTYNEEIR